MRFEFYVLNYDFNKKKVVRYNIFDNWLVQDNVEKEIRKYLRAPSKYTRKSFSSSYQDLAGFEALCKEVDSIIAWQERARCEYEICAGYAFEDDISKLEKWDCYEQCKNNIPIIAREAIYQYKQQLKGQKK